MVSSHARIKNAKVGNILIPTQTKRKMIVLDNKAYLISRLVAIVFLPNPDNLSDIDHIDKDCSHDELSNLRWSSRKDNVRHSISKAVDRFTLDNIFIDRWDCIVDAGNYLEFDSSSIIRCCKGKLNMTHGYKWKYVENCCLEFITNLFN
jgi:hypothetical protein